MRKKQWLAWGFACSLALGFLALAILLILLCEPLYALAIDWFRIEAMTGLQHHQLMEEYHGLVRYLTIPWLEPLQLHYFASSESGIFHFFEVKQLFLANNLIGLLALGVNGWFFFLFKKKEWWNELLQPLRGLILAPIGLALVSGLFFDRVFILFHRVFFRNDAWLFNPTTDPIIYALPQEYFMLCFLLVFIFVLVALWGMRLFAKRQVKKSSKRNY